MTGWTEKYTDEYGQIHDWDDVVPSDDEDDGEEPMTYRELAFDLAAAWGIEIEDFLDRQRLLQDGAEPMSPSWVDDENV